MRIMQSDRHTYLTSSYRFYERDVLKFLKRIRPDMQRMTDEQGMEWFEIRLSEQDAKAPVQAF